MPKKETFVRALLMQTNTDGADVGIQMHKYISKIAISHK